MFCIIVPISANFNRALPLNELVFLEAVAVTNVIFLALCKNSIDFTHGAFQ